jgi:hypothetical protein
MLIVYSRMTRVADLCRGSLEADQVKQYYRPEWAEMAFDFAWRTMAELLPVFIEAWFSPGHSIRLNKAILREAITRTFENRKMEIDAHPVGLSATFGSDPAKQIQWKAFLKRSSLTTAPDSLAEVVDELRLFFEPILDH